MEIVKKKRGAWPQGQSGNPKGRPQGVGEVTKLRNSIAEHLPEIITQLVTKAKAGDTQAARLLLERVLPPMKPIEQPIALSLPSGEGLAAQGVAIIQAVADGILSTAQGSQLLASVSAIGQLRETDRAKNDQLQFKKLFSDNPYM